MWFYRPPGKNSFCTKSFLSLNQTYDTSATLPKHFFEYLLNAFVFTEIRLLFIFELALISSED